MQIFVPAVVSSLLQSRAYPWSNSQTRPAALPIRWEKSQSIQKISGFPARGGKIYAKNFGIARLRNMKRNTRLSFSYPYLSQSIGKNCFFPVLSLATRPKNFYPYEIRFSLQTQPKSKRAFWRELYPEVWQGCSSTPLVRLR